MPAVETVGEVNAVQGPEQFQQIYADMRREIGKVIVGQDQVVEQLLTAVYARGHCVLVGVPGLAKTLLVSTLARVLSLTFKRVQFTPDLMPADITGTEIIQEDPVTRERRFVFMPGPIFANTVLADEVNRTPPKTQAALLEAMQERHVTSGGRSWPLPDPFFVLATQNPIEQEGTYPLPEAQLDRFMYMITVGYPSEHEERRIIQITTGSAPPQPEPILNQQMILQMQSIVRDVAVGEHILDYAVRLARASRPDQPDAPDFVRKWLRWGAGPRASQFLVLGAKSRAALNGRIHVTSEDIIACALPVLRHRIVTNYNAEADGVTQETVVTRLLESVARPLEKRA